jgi:hypothetical protein
MIDSRKGGVMDRIQNVEGKIDDLTERVGVVEVKLDRLANRVEILEEKVDEGFKAMDAGFVEQREYTEFSHAELTKTMNAGFSRIELKLDAFIDTQSQTNALVERRLKAREQRRRRP